MNPSMHRWREVVKTKLSLMTGGEWTFTEWKCDGCGTIVTSGSKPKLHKDMRKHGINPDCRLEQVKNVMVE